MQKTRQEIQCIKPKVRDKTKDKVKNVIYKIQRKERKWGNI